MLHVLFSLGPGRYALSAETILEVIPLVWIRPLPSPPRGVVGLVDYRGLPLVVIDLKLHLLGQPSQPRLSSRIMVVEVPPRVDTSQYLWSDELSSGPKIVLGLLAEQVNEAERIDPGEFSDYCLTLPEALHLGPVRAREGQFLQRVNPQQLLTLELQALLESGS